MTDIFGPIVTGVDITDALTAHLQMWMPTYLAEMERRSGRDAGVLQVPRSWTKVGPGLEQPTEAQSLPAAIVASEGTLDRPVERGDGTVDAVFGARVAILVAANTREASNALAQLYAAAVRLIVLQQPKPGTLEGRMWWLGEADAPLADSFAQGGWGCEVALELHLRAVATAFGGPSVPDLSPGPLPAVETAEIDIEPRSLT